MKELDRDICYRALQTRDPRFDGRLFVGVTSTGIYCRPICPARTPKRENCRFFPTSAAAQEAGFRACLRCRPEISPEQACWDGFELAIRAVLGQQITVEAARQLGNKLVLLCGDPVHDDSDPRLARTFPSARCLAMVDLSRIGIPKSRRATVQALAQAAVANPGLFKPLGSIEDSIAQLRAIRGIGEWTAQYIALRALREPDAFPATDIGILRGTASLEGVLPTAPQLIQRAEAWRPWRAYAAQYLWTAASGKLQKPTEVSHAR
jgi:3-methyladenine DNA glycosylase/8-oxoguanine DNA glycosylase